MIDKDIALQAGVAGAAVAFLQEAVLRMVPYTIIAIPLIALDMLYGIRAAKYRKETIRLSTAIRRTLTKIFSYLCWIILSSAVALAFSRQRGWSFPGRRSGRRSPVSSGRRPASTPTGSIRLTSFRKRRSRPSPVTARVSSRKRNGNEPG